MLLRTRSVSLRQRCRRHRRTVLIKTFECKVCGDVVMMTFYREHMLYVHGAGVSRQENASNKQPNTARVRKVHGAETKRNPTSEGAARGRTKEKSPRNKPMVTQPRESLSAAQKYKKALNSRKSGGGVVCILCGKRVPKGKLLEHKQDVHGEAMYVCSPARYRPSSPWVQIVQGGLPGLGKRHR